MELQENIKITTQTPSIMRDNSIKITSTCGRTINHPYAFAFVRARFALETIRISGPSTHKRGKRPSPSQDHNLHRNAALSKSCLEKAAESDAQFCLRIHSLPFYKGCVNIHRDVRRQAPNGLI
uniref:Uncharacterized protein n=1 Tax=Anopheles atroparvus TaxID=41427 RepID=A0AAG5DIV9_ANOAO